MTFATKVKSEISHNKGLIARNKKAFSYGMLLCGKSFTPQSISMTTENKYIAKLYAKLIFQQIPMQTSVTTREYNGNFQQSTYAVSVDDGEDRKTILAFYGDGEELLSDEEHRRAFVAGALLSAGNISDPQKDYHLEFEKGLLRAMELGTQMAGFGDIDIENNRRWCQERCDAAGLKAEFPLWQQGRKKIVEEIITEGYRCIIKSINNRLLPRDILGKPLDSETVAVMAARGIDICGENGEYHTIAVDGPIFKHKLEIQMGEILDFGDRSVIDIKV